MARPHEAVQRGAYALLATRDPDGGAPRVQPVSYWSDGHRLWFTVPRDAGAVNDLLTDSACALAVGDHHAVAVVAGRARIYSREDPAVLLLHAPALSGALTALTLRNARGVIDAVPRTLLRTLRVPAVRLPVMVRVTPERIDAVEAVDAVDDGVAAPAGVAPALPMSVPPDVRRALAGRRDVIVAAPDGGGLMVLGAQWTAGFTLSLPPGCALHPGAAATVAVGSAAGDQALLALSGVLEPPARLRPHAATWWHRGAHGSAPITPPAFGGVVLPE